MNVTPKGYFLGVVVIYILTITLHSGLCETVGSVTGPSKQRFNNGFKSVLNFAARQAEDRQHLGTRQAERLRDYLKYPQLKETRDTLGGTARPIMESVLYQYQRSPSISSLKNCKAGEVKHVVHGTFHFVGKSQTSSTDNLSGPSHSDTHTRLRGELHPVVQCEDDSMSLTVRRRWAVHLRIGPVNGSSFALSQLLPQCGYFIHKSWKDVIIVAEYKGCHVSLEDEYYVLPLLWRKAPVKMSCPVSPMKSKTLDGLSQCCSPLGLTVSIQGPAVTKELNVKVRDEWTPLLELVQHCGYSLERRNAEIVITAPFPACGITSKDGKYSLSLQIGEEIFTLACPISPTEKFQQSNQGDHSTITTKPVPETLKPFPWAPPFYLAPPHYPFPTYYHKTQDTAESLLSATTAFHSALGTPLQPDEQNHHVQQPRDIYSEQASSGHTSQVLPDPRHTISFGVTSAPPPPSTDSKPILQPRNSAFNPYYHYYHHPKIPLMNRPPKAPDPSPLHQVKSTFYTSEMADLPPSFNLNSAPEFYHKPPESFPPRYYAPNIAAKANLGGFRDPKYITRSSLVHTPASEARKEYRGNVYNLSQHKTLSQRMNENMRPDMMNKRALAPVTPVFKPLPPPADQHFMYDSSMNHNIPHYVYYYLPYDYQIYHGPQGISRLQGEHNPIPTYFPITQPTINAIPPNKYMEAGLGSADHRPEVPVHAQPAHAKRLNHESESTTYSDLSYDATSWEEWFNEAAEADYMQAMLYMFPLFYYPDEHPYKEADGEMQDHVGASVDPFFAPPCGPGTGSYFHCSVSSSCSTFQAMDCTSGEYFVFSLPKFVAEPKVVIPAHHSDVKVSCALKRLNSDPYLYFVPLNGCGVRKQMVDPVMVYQLDLETSDSDNSLMRMMVECSSYPGFLGAALTLYILDPLPPPYPAPVPVQLRMATDESFSSFHPEAHLPLSSLQGRMVFLELSLLQPPDPSMVLLVNYCVAYTQTPYVSAMLIYDSCASLSDSHLLPSIFSNTQYIMVTSFLSQTSLTPSTTSDEDPEVYFFCLTEVCSADGVCFVGCINSRFVKVKDV